MDRRRSAVMSPDAQTPQRSPGSSAAPASAAAPVSAIAFFDLDGTLIPGSANIPFAKAGFRAGFVTIPELLGDLRNGASFVLSGASDDRSAQVRDRILRAVAGHQASEVEALGEGFMPGLVESLRPQMAPVLAQHAQRGHLRVVLSASPTEIVSRFAEQSGLDLGIGTTAARDADGRYTGELTGPFCYRDGKAQIMAEFAEQQGVDLADCYAYSDSVSDLPMLEAVGHPVVVHPEAELRTIAEERGWPIIETSSIPRVSLRSPAGLARLATSVVASVGQRGRRLLSASSA